MTATLFRLHRLDTGRHAAWALLCADARYCSIAFEGVGHLVRRFAAPAVWKEVQLDLGLGLEPGPLSADLPLVRLIAGDQAKALVVQYVTMSKVEGNAFAVTTALDAKLRQQAAVTE